MKPRFEKSVREYQPDKELWEAILREERAKAQTQKQYAHADQLMKHVRALMK